MVNKLTKPTLSSHQKLSYQRRLSSFLANYAYRNKLKAHEVAQEIDISPQKYSTIKSDNKPYPKFINSLDYLSRFAQLEQMSLGEFVLYLEGKGGCEGDREGKIYSWQHELTEAFDLIKISVRRTFLEICRDSLKNGKEKLELLLRIVALLKDEDVDAIKSLEQALSKMLKKKEG